MPAWMRPDCIVGIPRRPPAGSGGRRSVPSGSRGCTTKGNRGRGHHAGVGVPGGQASGGCRAASGLGAEGSQVRVGAGHRGRCPPLQRGLAPVPGCESSPGGGARPEPSSTSSDSLLAKGLLSAQTQTFKPPLGFEGLKTQLSLVMRSGCEQKSGTTDAQSWRGERARGLAWLSVPPFLREMIKKQFPSQGLGVTA